MSTKKGIKTIVFAGATALTIFSLTACSSNKSSNSGNGSNKNAATASSSAKTAAKLPTDTGNDGTDLMNAFRNQGFTNIVKNDSYQDGTSFKVNVKDGYIDVSQDSATNSWIFNTVLDGVSDWQSNVGQACQVVISEDNLDTSGFGVWQPTTSQLKQVISHLSLDSQGYVIFKRFFREIFSLRSKSRQPDSQDLNLG